MRAPERPIAKLRTALEMPKPRWPNSSRSNVFSCSPRSAIDSACISFSTYGWQRIAPWPKIIRLRVMMLAPSTVIAIGTADQPRPA